MRSLILSLTLALTAAVASAQNAGQAAAPANAAATTAPAEKLPGVESVDILKQNQAERTQTQPGNLAPTYRLVADGTKHYSSLPALEAGVLIQGKRNSRSGTGDDSR
jgi:formate dehydrogenase subunit gamma